MPEVRSSRLAIVAWAIVSVVWGTTYLGIKVALETVPPFLLGGIRYAIAGVLLATILLVGRRPLPPVKMWPRFLLLGFLMFGLGNGGIVWAELRIPTGIVAVLVALTPFWMVGVEALIPGGDRPNRRHLIGLALGFAGIVLLVGPSVMGSGALGWGTLSGLIALQIAAAGWSSGSAYARRYVRQTEPLASAAMQMLGGAIVMLTMGTVAGEWRAFTLDTRSAAALLYLAIAGSLVAFAAYVYALEHLSVTFMSLYAYINPLIAVALGTLVLGEPFDLRMGIGIAIVLAGVAVVTAGGSGDGHARAKRGQDGRYLESRGFRKARLSRV